MTASESLLVLGSPKPRTICARPNDSCQTTMTKAMNRFSAQQAAEKTLKAYLASRSVRFANIHDLSRLLALAGATEAGFNHLADAAETLAPFAVEIRYPGDWDDLTRDEYAEVKRAAEKIVELVTEHIETEEN